MWESKNVRLASYHNQYRRRLLFQNHWHKIWVEENSVVCNKSESEERRRIKSGRFAVLAHVLRDTNNILLISPLDDDLVDGLRVVRDPLDSYFLSTAFRKNSPLKPFYDQILGSLFEKGVLEGIWWRSIWKYSYQKFSKLMVDPDFTTLKPETIAIKFSIFKYMLYLLAIGWTVSSICFILELLVYYKHWKHHCIWNDQ